MKPSISFLLIIFLTGCNRYFMPANSNTPSQATIKKYIDENKILILRDGKSVYEMKNVNLTTDAITCDLQRFSGLKISSNSKGKLNYQYKRSRPDSTILNQVHIFTTQKISEAKDTTQIIQISSLSKTEEIQFDKKKTVRTNTGIAIGIVVTGSLVIAGAAAIASIAEMTSWGDPDY